jgi:hypothetical protein
VTSTLRASGVSNSQHLPPPEVLPPEVHDLLTRVLHNGRLRSTSAFGTSGVCHTPHLKSSEVTSLCLPGHDLTVRLFSYDLQCRSPSDFGASGFSLSLTFAFSFTNVAKSEVLPGYPFYTFSRSDGRKGFSSPSEQILWLQHPKC